MRCFTFSHSLHQLNKEKYNFLQRSNSCLRLWVMASVIANVLFCEKWLLVRIASTYNEFTVLTILSLNVISHVSVTMNNTRQNPIHIYRNTLVFVRIHVWFIIKVYYTAHVSSLFIFSFASSFVQCSFTSSSVFRRWFQSKPIRMQNEIRATDQRIRQMGTQNYDDAEEKLVFRKSFGNS